MLNTEHVADDSVIFNKYLFINHLLNLVRNVFTGNWRYEKFEEKYRHSIFALRITYPEYKTILNN